MPGKKVYILTGNIQSGKTTKLLQWLTGRKRVFGILSPVVHDKRFFMNIQTGAEFDMEAKEEETEILKIGKYKFSKKSFDKAIEVLQLAIKEQEGWLVIDEIGPLELRKEGFYEILVEILDTKTSQQIILVVRNSLVNEVINFFNLDKHVVEIINGSSDFFNRN